MMNDEQLTNELSVQVSYVCGFLFDRDGDHVVLIRKNRPDWQYGLFDGVGGKIEEGESPAQAMRREFKEEAGVETYGWKQFAFLHDMRNYRVHFFFAFLDDLHRCTTQTDEPIGVWEVKQLPATIPNLRWLIPMALTMGLDKASHFEIIEFRS